MTKESRHSDILKAIIYQTKENNSKLIANCVLAISDFNVLNKKLKQSHLLNVFLLLVVLCQFIYILTKS